MVMVALSDKSYHRRTLIEAQDGTLLARSREFVVVVVLLRCGECGGPRVVSASPLQLQCRTLPPRLYRMACTLIIGKAYAGVAMLPIPTHKRCTLISRQYALTIRFARPRSTSSAVNKSNIYNLPWPWALGVETSASSSDV